MSTLSLLLTSLETVLLLTFTFVKKFPFFINRISVSIQMTIIIGKYVSITNN